MRKCAYALAATMFLSTMVPVMAEETSTEVETTVEIESEGRVPLAVQREQIEHQKSRI